MFDLHDDFRVSQQNAIAGLQFRAFDILIIDDRQIGGIIVHDLKPPGGTQSKLGMYPTQ